MKQFLKCSIYQSVYFDFTLRCLLLANVKVDELIHNIDLPCRDVYKRSLRDYRFDYYATPGMINLYWVLCTSFNAFHLLSKVG